MCSSARAKRWKSIPNRDVTAQLTAWFEDYAISNHNLSRHLWAIRQLRHDSPLSRRRPIESLIERPKRFLFFGDLHFATPPIKAIVLDKQAVL